MLGVNVNKAGVNEKDSFFLLSLTDLQIHLKIPPKGKGKPVTENAE